MKNTMIILEKEPTFKKEATDNLRQIKGRMRQISNGQTQTFYYQLDFTDSQLVFRKSKLPTMVNAINLENEEVLKLLSCVAKKSKNAEQIYFAVHAINQLITIFTHNNAMGDEPQDLSLMESDFSGKTEPIDKPLLLRGDKNSILIQGGLKGRIFYTLKFAGDQFWASKDITPRFLTEKFCSQDEVRCILNGLSEKFPQSREGYQTSLKDIEAFWEREEQKRQLEILKEEVAINPHFFLAPHEKIKPFAQIGPIFYKDEQNIIHLTFMEGNRVYHIRVDKENPVIELVNKQKGKIKEPAFKRIMSEVFSPDFENLPQEHQTAAYTIMEIYNNYSGAPEGFNHDETATQDIQILANSLSIEDIRQQYQAGAYTQQLSEASLPSRIGTNEAPMKAARQKRIEEMKRSK